MDCEPHHPQPSVLFFSIWTCFLSRGQRPCPPPMLACSLPLPWSTLIPTRGFLWPGFGQFTSCPFLPDTHSFKYSFFIILPMGFSFSFFLPPWALQNFCLSGISAVMVSNLFEPQVPLGKKIQNSSCRAGSCPVPRYRDIPGALTMAAHVERRILFPRSGPVIVAP